MPAVSVVVPSYNHARFLERRLRSILDQTFQDFEVVVLDDASTDDSARVLERFADHPRIRIEHGEANSGSPFIQWNKGVDRTGGALLWMAESDDDADPRFLETMVSRLGEHQSCGLAFSQSLCIDAGGRVLGTHARSTASVDPGHWRADYVNTGRDECERFLAIANTIPNASAVVFRRDVYERAGRAPETMRLAGDWMTWLGMLLVSDVAFVAEPLNRHRDHDATVRAAFARDERWWAESLQVWRAAHRQLTLPEATRTRIVDIVREVIVRLLPRAARRPTTVMDLYAFGRELDPNLPRSLARLVAMRGLERLRGGAPATRRDT